MGSGKQLFVGLDAMPCGGISRVPEYKQMEVETKLIDVGLKVSDMLYFLIQKISKFKRCPICLSSPTIF